MRARIKTDIRHMGYKLLVKLGEKFQWDGHLYPSRMEAHVAQRRLKGNPPYRIQGLRLDYTPHEYAKKGDVKTNE